MKLFLATLICVCAGRDLHAQATGVQVRDGDVYVRFTGSTGRLTRDGHIIEAIMSRDGNLIAYVHQGAPVEHGTKNDLYLCSVPAKSCVLLVAGREEDKTDTNLASIQNVRFSLQASQKAAGNLTGSLFFLSDASGANTMSLHRVPFGNKSLAQLLGSAAPFETYANAVEIVPSGRFAGALRIDQQIYTPQGACGQEMIFDPNTRKILQKLPGLEC